MFTFHIEFIRLEEVLEFQFFATVEREKNDSNTVVLFTFFEVTFRQFFRRFSIARVLIISLKDVWNSVLADPRTQNVFFWSFDQSSFNAKLVVNHR